MPCYRGEYKPNHPDFAEGSDAYIKDVETGPVLIDAPPIVYTEEDNEAIRNAIKKFGRFPLSDRNSRMQLLVLIVLFLVSGCWHTMGSAAMKPREKNGVVDPRLNVYGTEHLKVADLSICPANVGAVCPFNTKFISFQDSNHPSSESLFYLHCNRREGCCVDMRRSRY